jgi:hypothetical protein
MVQAKKAKYEVVSVRIFPSDNTEKLSIKYGNDLYMKNVEVGGTALTLPPQFK